MNPDTPLTLHDFLASARVGTIATLVESGALPADTFDSCDLDPATPATAYGEGNYLFNPTPERATYLVPIYAEETEFADAKAAGEHLYRQFYLPECFGIVDHLHPVQEAQWPDHADPLEARIADALITKIIGAGYLIRVWEEGDTYLTGITRDRAAIQAESFATGTFAYEVHRKAPAERIGAFILIDGNSTDMISDYSWKRGSATAHDIMEGICLTEDEIEDIAKGKDIEREFAALRKERDQLAAALDDATDKLTGMALAFEQALTKPRYLVTSNYDYNDYAGMFDSELAMLQHVAKLFGFAPIMHDGDWIIADDEGVAGTDPESDGTVLIPDDDPEEEPQVGCKLGSPAFWRWIISAYEAGDWKGFMVYSVDIKTGKLTTVAG